MFVTLLPSLEWARRGKQREVYQLRGAFLLFPTILMPGTGWIESASDDFCLVMWQKNDALVKQEIWEDGEPGVPRLPSTFYPYQVSAENHIILPNKLPFLPSTEKAGHFNFFFSQRTLPPHLTSPHLTSPRLASPRLASPHLASPHLTSPHLTSPHIRCYGMIVKYPWIDVTKTNRCDWNYWFTAKEEKQESEQVSVICCFNAGGEGTKLRGYGSTI